MLPNEVPKILPRSGLGAKVSGVEGAPGSAPSQVALVWRSGPVPFGPLLAVILPPCSGQDPRQRGLREHSEESASKNRDYRLKSSFSVFGVPSGIHPWVVLDTFLLNTCSVFMA